MPVVRVRSFLPHRLAAEGLKALRFATSDARQFQLWHCPGLVEILELIRLLVFPEYEQWNRQSDVNTLQKHPLSLIPLRPPPCSSSSLGSACLPVLVRPSAHLPLSVSLPLAPFLPLILPSPTVAIRSRLRPRARLTAHLWSLQSSRHKAGLSRRYARSCSRGAAPLQAFVCSRVRLLGDAEAVQTAWVRDT